MMGDPLQFTGFLQRRPFAAISLVWASIALLLVIMSKSLAEQRFPDVDDALRLVQVRDLLAGQDWYDLHQYRLNPPEGTLMHWSRLVDVPIAAMIWLLSQVLPVAQAEFLAASAIPLLLLLATMLFVGKLVWERFGGRVAILTALSFILMPVVPAQFQPLRIDHHGWQVLTVAAALWAIYRPNATRGAVIAGLAMAAGLMISLETIVMAAGFALVLTVRWLTDPRESIWLVRYLQALAGGMAGLFLLTRGLVDLVPHCDAISPPHLAFFGIVAAGTSLLARRADLHPAALIGGLAASGVSGLLLIGWAAPACLAPPFAGLDPLVRQYWYVLVAEGQPLWGQPPSEALPVALQCLFAIGIALYAAVRGAPGERVWWRGLALILAVASLAGFATQRSIAFAGMIATIPFGWFAGQMITRWQGSQRLVAKLGVAAAMFLAFLPQAILSPLIASSEAGDGTSVATSRCELNNHGRKLNALAPATLFAPLDIAPSLLTYTHHSSVASAHHRAERAMRDVILAFTSDPETARKLVVASGAQFLVICADMDEMKIYRSADESGSLAALLADNAAPQWLERVDLGLPAELRIWKVVPAP